MSRPTIGLISKMITKMVTRLASNPSSSNQRLPGLGIYHICAGRWCTDNFCPSERKWGIKPSEYPNGALGHSRGLVAANPCTMYNPRGVILKAHISTAKTVAKKEIFGHKICVRGTFHNKNMLGAQLFVALSEIFSNKRWVCCKAPVWPTP